MAKMDLAKRPGKKALAVRHEADGTITVEFWNLHVFVGPEDGMWFAQGYEIDYVASGYTEADAKRNFEVGLAMTVHDHVRMFGTIEKLLVPAPHEVWMRLLQATQDSTPSPLLVKKKQDIFSDEALLGAFPFDGIAYAGEHMEYA